jgi:hypothetical protein
VGYTATKGGASGRAQLDWQPLDEQQYRLTWRIELAGRESLAWRSQGHVGPAGLMPDRMVEQRQGRDLAAVNFQRDKGLVSFSGPSTTLPLPAGAQDRASWLLQLPMLAAAVQAHWTAGHSSVSLPVFTTRGEDQLWRFTVVAEETLPGPGAPLRTWRLGASRWAPMTAGWRSGWPATTGWCRCGCASPRRRPTCRWNCG